MIYYTQEKLVYMMIQPKTDGSDRYIKIPKETMDLILEYKQWFLKRTSMYKDRWHNTNYLFFQEKSGNEGKPMHPDSINTWLKSFSKKYNLPHITPMHSAILWQVF